MTIPSSECLAPIMQMVHSWVFEPVMYRWQGERWGWRLWYWASLFASLGLRPRVQCTCGYLRVDSWVTCYPWMTLMPCLSWATSCFRLPCFFFVNILVLVLSEEEVTVLVRNPCSCHQCSSSEGTTTISQGLTQESRLWHHSLLLASWWWWC